VSIVYRVTFSGEPPVGTLTFVSDDCAALIGALADDIIDRPVLWLEAIHDDDRERFVQTTAQLIADGNPVTRHYRLRHGSTGAYQLVEDRLTAALDAAGQVSGYEAHITKAH
jgi:hypothetical protein